MMRYGGGGGAAGEKLGDLGCVDGPLDYVLSMECEIYKVACRETLFFPFSLS